MKAGLLALVACLACCVAGLAVSPVSALAESSPPAEGTGTSSSLSGPLVTPGSPTEAEQLQAQKQAKLTNPEAVAVREESRTQFEGLNTEQAAKVTGEAFPKLVDEPAGGPPKLPAGQSITGYLTNNAASVDVGGGTQAVLESTVPIAVQRPSGELVPVALGLRAMGSVFEPSTPLVGVRIPKQLSDGVALPGVGVTVTPVNGTGASLGGAEGIVDGATVLYVNTQTDMDSLVKPTTDGFEADTLLRSVESPQQLFFRVGLPAGASLVQAKDGSGVVDVIKEGTPIATVLPAGALDAAGTSVPVSMSVSGDTLVLSVEDRSAEYQYPIDVDPTFVEEHFTETGSKRSNWQWETTNSSRFGSKPTDNKETKELSESSPASLETYGTAAYAESEKAYWAYQTQGDSKIYEFTAETEAKNTEDHIESFLELEAKGTGAQESKELLSDEAEKTAEYARKPATPICPKNSKGEQECTSTAGGEGNAVRFQQSVVNKPSSKYSFSDFLYKGEVYLSEPPGTHSTTKYNTSAAEFEVEVENAKKEKVKQKRKNAYGSGSWLSEYDGALELIAEDPGIGVSATKLEYESAPGKWEQASEHNYLTEDSCTGVQCYPKHTELWTLNKRLPNGEDKIRYRAEDAMGTAKHETESLETEGTATVKVDYSKPHGILVGGLPYGNELSEKTYELTTYATDGEGSTAASSGIMAIAGKEKGIALYVDGYEAEEIGTQTGCTATKGECTASAKWKISGQKLGAGHHAIVIVAKDRAGNEGRDEETISVRHSTPVPLGPGSLDLESGDFALGPTDVSLGGGLSVSRVYSSRDLTAGAEGGSLLGPQWSLSVGSEETLVELVDGSVLVTSGNGGETIFAAVLNSKGEPTGKFESPPGDSNLTMTLEENEKKEKVAYYLKDPGAGTSTKFVLSSTAKVWMPTEQTGLVPTDKVEYFYETVEVGGKKVTRPKEERGATPAKVSCAPKAEPGCRALKFTYATTTKATGEGPTEWGEYEGRLVKVSYEGYNPATKKMIETPIPVAEYAYDKQGRLRAVWDPRLAPHELKTEYGYDAEGHVTALTPPGQQSWAFTYGTIAGDTGTGRLLKIRRAPASAGLWNGKAPANTGAPKLVGATALIGARMGVSSVGVWSNSPVAYAYQWEDCNSKGESCTPIVGATNANYTLTAADVGHTIVAQVSAINGGGSVVALTTASAEVKAIEAEYALAERSWPQGIAAGSDGNLWVADYGDSISKVTVKGGVTAYKPTKSSCPTHIAAAPSKENYLWFTEYCPSYEEQLGTISTSGSFTIDKKFTIDTRLEGITAGPEGNMWFAMGGAGKIGEVTPSGTVTEYSMPVKSFPKGITLGPDGNLWYTNLIEGENAAISKINPTSHEITEYPLPSGSNTWAITAGPAKEKALWFVNLNTEKIGKITTAGEVTEYPALPSGSRPCAITAAPDGNLWFVDCGSGRIGKITTSGTVTEFALPSESRPTGITAGPGGEHAVWFTEEGSSKVGKVNLAPPQGETYAPQPGTTIDYNVPVSGTGAPHNMSTAEVAKWGQKAEEAPEEATAIFPADSPQGWPATSYTRATIYYLDQNGRVVNAAIPSTGTYGAISTTEYNETNDVIRTLTPDNRATALEAGEKAGEMAKLLSTENTYNGEGEKETEVSEPGTRLLLSRGPEHMVKYVAGEEHYEAGEKPKEAMARSLSKYFYNEGAPTENPRTKKQETYDLVTTTQNYAQLINGEGKETETQDVNERKTSYSGQEDLGWELRAPTSVTTNPGSLNLTTTTEYYESGETMGEVKETRGPGSPGGNSAHDSKIIDYTLEENKEGYPSCGKHAEWAGLACETLPTKQPETIGVPNLPETTTTYNIWSEPETIVETFPKSGTLAEHTRTTKDEYDAAGRMKTSVKTSTATTETTDKTLPKVTEEYNEKTGVLEKQSTTVGEKTQTITSKYNTFDQLESYTDADGNVAKFKYAGPEGDELLEEMSDSSDNGESNQKLTYNATTKQLTKLVDSAAGTFTASYDTEGKLASEVYPNGMCANYSNNSVGEATHIVYTKTSSCSETEGVWFSEAKIAAIRGEVMGKTSTLASEAYAYDQSGRLTEVQETPAGEYCKTRSYVYDKESNRTKLTVREPNSKKECNTEGGTVQEHKYDEANRLIDSEITYDPLGNVTKLPSGDAEGHALESTFYLDNAVATQTQNGVTDDYYMDPDGRVRETITGAKKAITHYDGSGEAVAWICEGSEKAETCESGGKWTRNIPGIDGTLVAVQSGAGAVGETPILELHDLEGDVVATIRDKTGETKLESTYNSTEFGAPNGGKEPPKFAWLGAGGVEKSLASGVITEGATSYVPQTGQALQSEQVAPPGLPDGAGAGAPYIFQEEPWVLQGATREADEAPGLEAGREREAEEAACRANPEACSEDPYWSGDVSIKTAAALSGALLGIEIAYYVSDGTALELAEKALEIAAEHLNINFLSKLKEVAERGLFGYSLNDVAEWVFHTGGLLQTCYEAADHHQEHPKNPHCWLSITTTVRHVYKGGPGMEIPNFGVTPEVGYCPWGTYSECLIVNDW